MKQRELLRKIYWITGFLILFILAFLISVIFLNPSSVGNQNFLSNFTLWASIWSLTFIVVLVLIFVLARNLIHLFFEYHGQHAGSRIKSKLILTFVIFSLFPALIMFFLAFGLINQNLTKWVSAPSEQLLESSQTVAEEYYEEKKMTSVSAAEWLAAWLAQQQDLEREDVLSRARLLAFDGFVLVGAQGQTLLSSGGRFEDMQVVSREYERVLARDTYYSLRTGINLEPGMIDRGIVGVAVEDASGIDPKALFLSFIVPESVAFHAESVREAAEAYTGLRGSLASLRINYFSILAMTTLAVVFGFVWLGNYIARRLTVPLEALAEGSGQLAAGNLDYRVNVSAVDELGILVNSFNRMAEQLKESREQLERANFELKHTNIRLDERRRYIETIMQNIGTAVLTIDESEVIRTANQAALKLLQASPEEIISRKIRKVSDPGLYSEFLEMKKRARIFGTYRRQVTIQRNDRQLYVAVTITAHPFPTQDKVEYLLVLDDLTELIRAEKFAAWQEVARRLAHEIKNPLTPIQLSAERIKRRFEKISARLPQSQEVKDFEEVLLDAARIIVAESRMLRNLLGEFSRFARLPICKPEKIELHGLIEKTLTFYDGGLHAVSVRREFDPTIGEVAVDPEQMRRVFVNLIDNSLDALVDVEDEREIVIRTAFNESRRTVRIEFSDSGHGIPADDYEHLFLPYFSTKKKGTGLGLAIVRQIVSEHGGFIRAEPNSPRGTRVVLEFPVA